MYKRFKEMLTRARKRTKAEENQGTIICREPDFLPHDILPHILIFGG